MKGIVFTEFMEMVADRFGADMVDELIDQTEPASGGAYTSVGTYDYHELLAMAMALSEREQMPLAMLIEAFGFHLAGVFYQKFPSFFDDCKDSRAFLKRIDDHIHVEVRKLYPDAELPHFAFEEPEANRLLLTYQSSRNFADLARGLIRGAVSHYGEVIELHETDLSEDRLTRIRFDLCFVSA